MAAAKEWNRLYVSFCRGDYTDVCHRMCGCGCRNAPVCSTSCDSRLLFKNCAYKSAVPNWINTINYLEANSPWQYIFHWLMMPTQLKRWFTFNQHDTIYIKPLRLLQCQLRSWRRAISLIHPLPFVSHAVLKFPQIDAWIEIIWIQCIDATTEIIFITK